VALHWVPAAAEPWLGLAGGLAAGLSTWMQHACVGALVVAASIHLRETLPLALRAGAAWGVLEWLPGAIPVLGLPWFGVAATLTGWPALLPVVAVAGSGGVGILLAAASGAGIQARQAPRVAVVVLLGVTTVIAATLLLPGLPAPAASMNRMAALEWERPRAEVADPERLQARVEAMLRLPLPADDPPGIRWRCSGPRRPFPGYRGPVQGARGRKRTSSRGTCAGSRPRGTRERGRFPGTAPATRPRPRGSTSTSPGTDRVAPASGAVTGIQARVAGRRYNALVRTGALDDAPEGVHRKRYLVPGWSAPRSRLRGGKVEAWPPAPGRSPSPGEGCRWVGSSASRSSSLQRPRDSGDEGPPSWSRQPTTPCSSPGGAFPWWGMRPAASTRPCSDSGRPSSGCPRSARRTGARAQAAGPDGRRLEPAVTFSLGEGEGRWLEFQLPPAAAPPPSAWVGPPLGPLALALLVLPLVALWRRSQVLTPGRR
jgi:hypothetical protein